MKELFFSVCLCATLISCSGGSGSDGGSAKVSSSSVELQKGKEIQRINTTLNGTEYSLTLDEIETLKSEGLISQEDYNELIKLASK